MKTHKSLISLILVSLMVVQLFAISGFALNNGTVVKTYDVVDGVKATEYDITAKAGAGEGEVYDAFSLEFSDEEYIPVVFSCWAGSAATLDKQYKYAVKKYGYEVAAVINGSFFSMDSGSTPNGNYGILVGMNISNGKISSSHVGYSGEVVAFDSDGEMHVVNSYISYKMYFNGVEVPNGLYYINKYSGSKATSTWSDKFYYFDASCGTTADTYSHTPGYEILCKKVNNTDLAVGSTLEAEVLEIKANSYGTKFEQDTYSVSDNFVLFVKDGSAYAEYAKSLNVGDRIEINAEETIEDSKEIMENANSVITNVGYLVKNGVNLTKTIDKIGTHPVTMCARWTAFGVKADGSYVFFTSEGGSTGSKALTLKDVAQAMIDMGCVDVIRMDGGGSSAMYVCDTGSGEAGYLQSSSRSVGDCILLVKRSSMEDADLNAALDAIIADFEGSESEEVKEALEEAKEIQASKIKISGDVKRAIMNLLQADSKLAKLDAAISAAEGISYKDYSAAELSAIWEAYQYAKAVRSTADAAEDAVITAATRLYGALNISTNAALGKPYTVKGIYSDQSGVVPYPDEGGTSLTDGAYLASPAYSDPGWVGLNVGSPDMTVGAPSNVIVDLGANFTLNKFALGVFDGKGDAGIDAPKKIEFFISSDNKAWTSVGVATYTTAEKMSAVLATLELDQTVSGRYVKAEITHSTNWAFVSEIMAYSVSEKVSDVGFVTQFNRSILSGNAAIFTPEVTPALTLEAANVKWAQTVILEWDPQKEGYKVVAVKAPDGNNYGKLLSNQIALAVHDSQLEGDSDGSTANRTYLTKAVVGDYIEFHGIYTDACDILPGGFFKVVKAAEFDKNFNGILGEVDFDIPTDGALTGEVSLVPEMVYDALPAGGGTIEYSFNDDILKIVDKNGGWPCITGTYADPLVVPVNGTKIAIDFTVESGYTSIRLNTADGQSIFLHQQVNAAEGSYDSGSGDLGAGTYKTEYDLKDIKASVEGTLTDKKDLVVSEKGNVTFTSIVIYATSNATVTINKLEVIIPEAEEVIEPEDGVELEIGDDIIGGIKEDLSADEVKKLFKNTNVQITGISNKTNKVGTGCVIKVANKEYTVVVKGDINGDGILSPTDYASMRAHILALKVKEGVFEAALHVKGGAGVTANDYIALRAYLLGLIDTFN